MFGGKLYHLTKLKSRTWRDKNVSVKSTYWSGREKGTRRYHLEMLPKYPNFQYFLDTLCHEMVHLYQMQNLGDTGNHNELFWSFEKKAKPLV